MQRHKVDSSQIESVGFDPDTNQMDVEFKGGAIYRYQNVESEVVGNLVFAPSVGRFFGSVIKAQPEKYPYVKIKDRDAAIPKKGMHVDAVV